MLQEGVFTITLESELLADFLAEAAGEQRHASEVMRELMRGYIQSRRQAPDDDADLRSKVEAGRVSMLAGQGSSNEIVETFAAKRAHFIAR
jgi:metal-responsive CopG/Arc/MetJ family transcriptional regulator